MLFSCKLILLVFIPVITSLLFGLVSLCKTPLISDQRQDTSKPRFLHYILNQVCRISLVPIPNDQFRKYNNPFKLHVWTTTIPAHLSFLILKLSNHQVNGYSGSVIQPFGFNRCNLDKHEFVPKSKIIQNCSIHILKE